MKRRLAIILVLAMVVTALSGIAIFSSAAESAVADYYRLITINGKATQYNPKITSVSESNANIGMGYGYTYNYVSGVNGVAQKAATLTVELDEAMSVATVSAKGNTDTFSSDDMDALVNVLIKGEGKRVCDANSIPGFVNAEDGFRFLYVNITSALTKAGTNEVALAAIKTAMTGLFTALKTAGADLDGVVATSGDAGTLDKVLFAPLVASYPAAITAAQDAYASYTWQDTANGATRTAAGNNSYYIIRTAPASGFKPDTYVNAQYTHSGFNALRYDTMKLRDIYAASNGGDMIVEFRYYEDLGYGADANMWEKEQVYHAGLLNATFTYDAIFDGTRSGYLDYSSKANNVAYALGMLNNLVGWSDRTPIVLPASWNDDFLVSGMTANGRAIWRISLNIASGKTLADYLVADAADPTIVINGQTITFPGGTVLKDTGSKYGYWVETASDVTPVVSYEEGRYAAMKEPNIVSFDFVPVAGTVWGPGYFGTSAGDTSSKAVIEDGVLKLANSCNTRHWTTIDSFTKSGGIHRAEFAMEISVTMPGQPLPAGSQLQVMRADSGDGVIHRGIILCDGRFYYGSVSEANMMTMNGSVVPGETYKFRIVYTDANTDAAKMSFYVIKADGTVLASAENIVQTHWMNTSKTSNKHVSFGAVNVGSDPVILDNFRIFTIQPDLATSFGIYDVAAGTEVTDTETPSVVDLGYRYTYKNITSLDRKVWIMAQYYDAEGLATGEPVLIQEVAMNGDSDGVLTGTVSAGDGAVRLYLRYENKWAEDLYCEDTGYGYEPAPYAVPISGTAVTFKFSNTIDGEFLPWDDANPLPMGTNYFKAYAEGNVDYAEMESEPVAFEVVFAENSWITEPTCYGVSYGQLVAPFAVPKFGAAEDVIFLYSTERNGEYTEEAPTASGSYWFKAYMPAQDVCYEMMSEPVSFAIYVGKQDLAIVNIPENLIVFGDEFTLDVEGAAGEGALTWEITTGADFATIDENGKVTITGVGTVTVTVTKAGDDNHLGGTATYTFTSLKAIPEVEAPTGLTGVYGDTLADIALPEGWAWADENATLATLGTAYFNAVYTHADAANYETVTAKLAIEVAKAENEWTTDVAIEGWTYGETANAPVGAAKFGNVVFTYSDAEDGNYTAIVPTAAGTYWLKATVYDSSKYSALTVKVSFTIAAADQAEITITGKPESVTYGDAFALGVTGGNGTGAITWTVAGPATIDENGNVTVIGAGEVTVTVTKAADANYNEASATYTFTAAKAATNVTAPEGLTAIFGSDLSSVALPEGWAWVDGTVKVGNVGNNTFAAVYTPADANCETVEAELTVAVAALDASDATIDAIPDVTLGSADPVLKVTLGETVLVLGTDYTVAYTNNTAVGTATATVTFIGNYAGTAAVDFEIVCAEHAWDEGKVAENGMIVYTCTACGETKEEANHGDSTNLVLMTALAAVSATALAAVLYIGKKKNAF